MNKLKIVLAGFFIFLLTLGCVQKKETTKGFSYTPEKPVAGEEITVSFVTGKDLSEVSTTPSLIIYTHTLGSTSASEVELKNDNGRLWASLTLPAEALSATLVFNTGEKQENNGGKGYRIVLFDKDGMQMSGADAAYVDFVKLSGYSAELSSTAQVMFPLINEDLAKNSELLLTYFNSYFRLLRAVKPDDANEIIDTQLKAILEKYGETEKSLNVLALGYNRLNDSLSAHYREKLINTYPTSRLAINSKISSIYRTKDLTEKKAIYNGIKALNPNEDLRTVANAIIIASGAEGNLDQVYATAAELGVEPSYYVYSGILSSFLRKKEQPDLILKLADLGINASKDALNNPAKIESKLTPLSTHNKNVNNTIANYYQSIGIVHTWNKNDEAAYENLKKAFELSGKKEADKGELYLKTALAIGKSEEVLNESSALIEIGESSPVIDSVLEVAYNSVKGNLDGFDSFYSKLKAKGKEHLIAELKSEMKKYSAPGFSLVDLNGDVVTLESLKGKIVVVDFWATWCGPCRASFPGLKIAVEKYSSNPNVAFVFINSWETVADKKQNAMEFMVSNDYPFQVLMDEDNKVISQFEVDGIPTKFILDKAGNVVFKSVGYSGNNIKMVEEIELMIELAGNTGI